MMFVNEVAAAAEAAGHHPDPDINIRWNQITLALSSHAEGGLTERDFQLGARIPELDRPPARLTTGATGHVVAGPEEPGAVHRLDRRLGTASDHRW